MQRRFVATGLVALVAVVGFLAWKGDQVVDRVLDLRFGGHIREPRYPFAKNDADANVQDVDYLARLTEEDRSFSDEARLEFARRVAKLKERAATLSRGELLMGIARALAAADNPHTNVERAYWRAYLNSAPVRLEWFEEGLYIVRARETQASLLGYRVAAIDGKSPELIVRDASHYFGGPPEHGRVSSLLVMESPQALHAIYPDAPADRLALSLDDGSGNVANVELPAVDPHDAPPVVKPGRLLSPESDFGEKEPWVGILADRSNFPVSLRKPSQSVYWSRLAADVLYLHLWSIHSDTRGRLDAQLREAFSQASAWRRIVIDLRFDTGGDYPDLYHAIEELPSHLARDGKVIVITDNTTFSAAIITTALVKHFAGERAVIVGERPRDRLVFWAEGGQMQLPNSKIEIPVSTGLHDWAHGCRDPARCYWPNIWYGGIGVGNVEPDVRVGWRFSDYRRGIDTALARALDTK
ncbi:MAG TPA: hypothetical protein VLH12_10070 [Usitatibacter sp.]|nr:hypothetical protein [Usitatibacter sp.]